MSKSDDKTCPHCGRKYNKSRIRRVDLKESGKESGIVKEAHFCPMCGKRLK